MLGQLPCYEGMCISVCVCMYECTCIPGRAVAVNKVPVCSTRGVLLLGLHLSRLKGSAQHAAIGRVAENSTLGIR